MYSAGGRAGGSGKEGQDEGAVVVGQREGRQAGEGGRKAKAGRQRGLGRKAAWASAGTVRASPRSGRPRPRRPPTSGRRAGGRPSALACGRDARRPSWRRPGACGSSGGQRVQQVGGERVGRGASGARGWRTLNAVRAMVRRLVVGANDGRVRDERDGGAGEANCGDDLDVGFGVSSAGRGR